MVDDFFDIDFPDYKPVEVLLEKEDDFLKVRETLSRIGVASKKDKTLYQSCHILHKQGRYFITHFKELFALDGKEADLTDNDLKRRNAISKLLSDWGLVKLLDKIGSHFGVVVVASTLVSPLPHRGGMTGEKQGNKFSIAIDKSFDVNRKN